ncbi:CBS domain-containing protein [Pontiellaceae bacterium B1224]|nr:CBS domain-containing protein [Pontiellaceae bacterium B1224]
MSTVATLLNSKGHEVLTVEPGLPVHKALEKMAERAASTCVAVENDEVTGIVSERDVIRKIILKDRNSHEVSVQDIMSTELTAVAAETSIEDCMGLMTQQRIRHLPVMCGKKLCGIVSIGDVVKFLAAEQDITIKNLEKYITGTM